MSRDLTLAGPQMTRADVMALEREMLAMEQVEIPVRHEFLPDGYHRTITVPAGTTLTGAIHKFENRNVLREGTMSVRMEDGTVVLLTAPAAILSPPGVKRIAYAHTECVWTTHLKTDMTDVAEIERTFIAPDESTYLAHVAQLQLAGA